MNRQLRMGGGIMNAVPRENYGLGSLVKSVTKGVKSAVSGAVDAVKGVAKSDLGKAALLAGGAYYLGGLGGATGFGRFAPSALKTGLLGTVEAGTGLYGGGLLSGLMNTGVGQALTGGLSGGLGKTLGVFAGGSLLGGLLAGMPAAEQEEFLQGGRTPEQVEALRIKLTDAYRSQRTFAGRPDEDAAIAAQVERDLAEYAQASNRAAAAYGGRIGYGKGTQYTFEQFLKDKEQVDRAMSMEELRREYERQMQLKKVRDQRNMAAYGGRMQYALGDRAEDNAMQASNAMGLPLNQNPAGVTELDLRETGGFIPPVGVKEKADDIPAMLSNNEFVFTADAVRGMGGGDVNKGAQRMYDMMKKLEKGGRV
jgi:hypothetical protein